MTAMHDQNVAYAEELLRLGSEDKRIVVVDPDSNKTPFPFQETYPDRYFEVGIAEANCVSFAGGLALSGKIAFANAFSVFIIGRAYDQARQSVAIPRANVKLVGFYSGFSDSADGATHQCFEDIALARALPHMTVLTPADSNEVVRLMRWSVAHDGPTYMRLTRGKWPQITPDDAPLTPYVLHEGNDIAIFAIGTMVSRALDAAEMLEREGISARVINIPMLKPLDDANIQNVCVGCKAVITCEEHSVIGGLSQTVAWALRGTSTPIEPVAVMDTFGQSARDHGQLLDHYGLSAKGICEKARALV